MIALFTIIYVLGIWLVYVKMKIKPSPTNVALSTVIGVVVVALIVILWKFSSPTSSTLVVSRYAVQLVPQVRGPITKIHAAPNVQLRKGKDVLFEVQKDTYQLKVSQFEAALGVARENVDESQAGIRVAEAAVQEAEASQAAAEAALASAKQIELTNAAAISELRVVEVTQQFAAAVASVQKSMASKEQAVASLRAAESAVNVTQAQLDNALFDLKQCTVYAPADGFVTNWQVREGTMAVPLPLAPLGTFIDTSETSIVATFGQNILKNVAPGDRVEFSFKSRPGQVYTGTVDSIVQATGEGQFTTTGELSSVSAIGSDGMFAVKLALDDEEVANSLAMGTSGMVAIYTNVGRPFHVISKVTVRINAWMYFLVPI